jgi:hypothetical protein
VVKRYRQNQSQPRKVRVHKDSCPGGTIDCNMPADTT